MRETNEEVGLLEEQIEILGEIGPPETSLGGMRVWPYVVSAHQIVQRINRDPEQTTRDLCTKIQRVAKQQRRNR